MAEHEDIYYNPDKLTQKALRFCEEYCVDFNRTAAEIRAGYLPGSGPSFNDPRIEAQITRYKNEHSNRINLSVAMILQNLVNIANGHQFDHLTVDPNDPARFQWDFTKATENQRRAIKKIKATKYGLEVEMHDAVAANVKLGQYLRMWSGDEKSNGADEQTTERIEITFVDPVKDD